MSRLSYFGYFHPILYFLRVYILSQSVINQSLQKQKGFFYTFVFSKAIKSLVRQVLVAILPNLKGLTRWKSISPSPRKIRTIRKFQACRWPLASTTTNHWPQEMAELGENKGFDWFQSLFISFYRHAALWLCSRMLQAFDCVLHFFTRSGL